MIRLASHAASCAMKRPFLRGRSVNFGSCIENVGSSAFAASSRAFRRMWLYVFIIDGETWPICA
ncbi:MAG TPA: hypothetical protein VN700_07770 [Vicinamibacterales bacterium]|nr:hypothetical protein [Vicinamibacterales bacterium]